MPDLSTQLTTQLAGLPKKPGCYLFRDSAGEILYVGKAKVLRHRVRSYFQSNANFASPAKFSMVRKVADIETIVVGSELEALILESTLIKKYQPHYNVVLKDDKNYLFIKVTVQEDFPQVLTVRRVQRDGARYFGPFTNSFAVRETLKLLQRIFPYRTCELSLLEGQIAEKRYTPCLRYHLGRCDAPCVEKINKTDYRAVIDKVVQFLEGRLDTIAHDLTAEMHAAAKRHDFEIAARLRDQLSRIDHLRSKQVVLSPKFTNQDVIGFVTDKARERAFASLLLIREGKVIGQEHLVLTIDPINTEQEIARAIILQHYEQATFFPRELVVSVALDDTEAMEALLERRMHQLHLDHRLHIRVGRRGAKKRLLAMAEENALEFRSKKTQEWNARDLNTRIANGRLGAALRLEAAPERVEIYDISNIQGTSAVGSMVVFIKGQSAKHEYRRFKIATLKEEPNDVGMMKEVLRRRLRRLLAADPRWPRPDLIIVDGGKPQLNAALSIMDELDLDIPLAGLAKREEELFVPGRSTSIVLPRESAALHLVQRMRDEAHRFAITFHRQVRAGRATKSVLDEVVGIGPKRKKMLLERYGSIAAIADASETELGKLISEKAAKALLAQLR